MLRVLQRLVALSLTLAWVPASAMDCVQPADTGTPVAMRIAPKADAVALRSLVGQAPLVAIIPRWYETRTPAGDVAFVSKQATNIVSCAGQPAGAVGAAGEYRVHAIDVGTGLAIFVRGPNFTVLYDAGSNDDLARGENNRAVAYLRAQIPAVSTINHLLLSHPHRDHVELLPDVFRQFTVREVWNSGAMNDICGYRAFLRAVKAEASVKYHTATFDAGNESISLGEKRCYGTNEPQETIVIKHADRISDTVIPLGAGASMKILHAHGTKLSNANENSLVVRLDLGSKRVLLMGDAEAGGRKTPSELAAPNSIEGKLLGCCIDELKADVLVMGHHGSMTSSRSTFLDAVGAKTYIISSGPKKYGSVVLPDEAIVQEAESRGIVFRTDIDDEDCAQTEEKVGADVDGAPGGCSNIVLTLPQSGPITGEYVQPSS